jgi:hypothetical protein
LTRLARAGAPAITNIAAAAAIKVLKRIFPPSASASAGSKSIFTKTIPTKAHSNKLYFGLYCRLCSERGRTLIARAWEARSRESSSSPAAFQARQKARGRRSGALFRGRERDGRPRNRNLLDRRARRGCAAMTRPSPYCARAGNNRGIIVPHRRDKLFCWRIPRQTVDISRFAGQKRASRD